MEVKTESDLNPRESCHICGACTIKWCDRCKRPFCVNHQCPDSYLICIACVDNNVAQLDYTPLTGKDGVTHQGKHITLVGEFWIRNNELIAQLTDEELRIKLKGLIEAVRGTEMMLDNLRINKTQYENESERRIQRSKRASLTEGQARLDMIKQRSKNRVTLNQNPKAQIDALKDMIKLLKARGLTEQQCMEVLQRLAAKK